MSKHNFSFESTGDSEKDKALEREMRDSLALRDADLCPNCRISMVKVGPHDKQCSQCHFYETRY